MVRIARTAAVVVVVCLLHTSISPAQSSGVITGRVVDETGGVLLQWSLGYSMTTAVIVGHVSRLPWPSRPASS